jgi:hypothetical protein
MVISSSYPTEDVMAEPKALSIGQIAHAAQASVKKASADHKALLPTSIHTVGYFPPRHWLGYVIYKPKIDATTFAEASKLASTVHSDIAAAVPGAKGGKAGISFDGDLLTIGFAPPPDVDVFQA